jgi:hypothetical protein
MYEIEAVSDDTIAQPEIWEYGILGKISSSAALTIRRLCYVSSY